MKSYCRVTRNGVSNMLNDPIRVALAGAGMVTRHHLIAWSREPGAEVVAIQNRTAEKARRRASEFGIRKTYRDLEDMLDQEKPDALDIAVAVEKHAEYARMAADRGIHILCQKPMTPVIDDARMLVNEIGNRVRFMVHENWRFRPQYRQTSKWIAQGRAGFIREFRLATHNSGFVSGNPRVTPPALKRQPFMARLPRLIIFELLIHHLDTIRYLMGKVQVVDCRTQQISSRIAGEDMALIVLKTENGAFGTVSGNMSAAGFPPLSQDRLELIGERASIIFEGDQLHLTGKGEETLRFDLTNAYQKSYDNAIAHFVEALRSGHPFETDRLDNLETLQLVEDAYRKAGL